VSACRIVGVGQRLAGDDGAGLAVIDHLRCAPLPPGVTAGEVREPSALIELLSAAGAPRLVIVDAIVGERPGEVLELAPADVERGGLLFVSSHALSVPQALALARAVQADAATPARVQIVAITISRATPGVQALTPPVAAAVPRAARRALELASAVR
jgi:hydrogenase maturation protease